MDHGPAPPHFENAKCKGKDVRLWFPVRGELKGPAPAICATCDHLDACREWGVEHPRVPGIYGGLSNLQRLLAARARRSNRQLTAGETMGRMAAIEDLDLEPADEELVELEAEHDATGPAADESYGSTVVCTQCAKPATPGRPTCGSAGCVSEHRKATKRARYNANGRSRTSTQNPATAARTSQAARNGAARGVPAINGFSRELTSSPVPAGFGGLPGFHAVAYLLEDGGALLPIVTRSAANGRIP